jgi:uncharacterized protein (UPF0548 family)
VVRERYRCPLNVRQSPGVPTRLVAVLKLRRPSEGWLRDLAERERDEPFSYVGVGDTRTGVAPIGYRRGHWSVDLGVGDEVFERAVAGLQQWLPQRGSGLAVGAPAIVEPGAVVALAAPTPVGHVVATCRVVYVEAEADRYAWAYGSLPIHPERGEERFAVVRRDDLTTFQIDVFFTLRDPLGRLAPPIARRLQARATQRYLDAMVASQRSSL